MMKAALKTPTSAEDDLAEDDLYERDFYAWTQAQAELLRARRFAELDLENLIDEVGSLGASEKREIRSRPTVLITRLLEWKYQPGARSSSWSGTIVEQRMALDDVLAASPSLLRYPAEVFPTCFISGRPKAADQTGIDFTLFPEVPPFTLEQTLDAGFLPPEPDLLNPPKP